MTMVSIHAVQNTDGGHSYQAFAGDRRSNGNTPGQALDGIVAQLAPQDSGTFVVVQTDLPDRWFTQTQRERLACLMKKWRTSRDKGSPFPEDEQAELDALVAVELRAAELRAEDLADDLNR